LIPWVGNLATAGQLETLRGLFTSINSIESLFKGVKDGPLEGKLMEKIKMAEKFGLTREKAFQFLKTVLNFV
jgi:hypothetical protein